MLLYTMDCLRSIVHEWRSVALVFVMFYCFRLYWHRRRVVNLANKLPHWNIKFFQVLGHLQLVMFNRIMSFIKSEKPLISPSVYDFQAYIGYNYTLRERGLSLIWQIWHPFITVYKADYVEVILNHSTEIKKAWFYKFICSWLGISLLTSHGEHWRNRRKLLTPAFHFNILKDFLYVFNKQSDILRNILLKHTQQDHVDIVPLITRCSLDIICESVMGKQFNSQAQPNNPYFKAVSFLTSSIIDRLQSPWLWSDFLFGCGISSLGRNFSYHKKITQDFTDQMIFEKKREKLLMKEEGVLGPTKEEDDEFKRRKKRALLDLLLDEHINNNSITEQEIREEVETFTFEGHDTTSVAMSWALYLLGLHPWVQERVHAELDAIFGQDEDREATQEDLKEMKYLECVIKETLRIFPSVPVIARELQEDVDFNGYMVPKGSSCIVLTYLLHRDPDVFPNPEQFDPDRFSPDKSAGRHPFAYVPFSAGPRNCIGQRFALMEEKVVLSSVLRRFKVRSMEPRDRVLVMDELVLRPLQPLLLQIRERNQEFDFKNVYYRP